MSDVVVSTDDSLCGGGAVAPTAAATGPGPPTGSAVGAAADIIIVLYAEVFVPYSFLLALLICRCVRLPLVVCMYVAASKTNNCCSLYNNTRKSTRTKTNTLHTNTHTHYTLQAPPPCRLNLSRLFLHWLRHCHRHHLPPATATTRRRSMLISSP
mmetsp:Transcript_23231/g.55079  ORF Transcript_23231/g.55079 Transcript_23231/m.55079 type:complete len:155 (+) Transcript_23231:175-639(+)